MELQDEAYFMVWISGEGTMKTISISAPNMKTRTSRYANLKPLPLSESLNMSQEAKDVIYARKILSVIGLGGDVVTPVNKGAPIWARPKNEITEDINILTYKIS